MSNSVPCPAACARTGALYFLPRIVNGGSVRGRRSRAYHITLPVSGRRRDLFTQFLHDNKIIVRIISCILEPQDTTLKVLIGRSLDILGLAQF